MARWNRIVVGVDGSTFSRQALEWACDEAQTHGHSVVALATWTPAPVVAAVPYGAVPWGNDIGELPDAVTTMLDDTVRAVASHFPAVRIEQQVIPGNAAAELIDMSERADLVVVGAKGHGGFTGMLLGSVSQHVLAHSHCTVVVVR